MKRLFNGTCSRCRKFKPRCVTVYFRVPGTAISFEAAGKTLCGDCRKSKKCRGQYRLDAKHKW